jgi:hypothetical protein
VRKDIFKRNRAVVERSRRGRRRAKNNSSANGFGKARSTGRNIVVYIFSVFYGVFFRKRGSIISNGSSSCRDSVGCDDFKASNNHLVAEFTQEAINSSSRASSNANISSMIIISAANNSLS